ncbi:TetR family transcriptional regulator [Isoptericola sp. NPDC019482]|uniref:TetR/AcrR family transcriptional regulator n=1 Tax=Isoptericola sp. NPDC019482 TaxID=3154688 RepID=UPI003473AEF5
MAKGSSGISRKQMRVADRRRLLVEAALRVMAREGVAAASTRAITQEAGMPHGAFHYCFEGKQDLYRALLAAEIDVDLDALWASVVPSAAPADVLEALLLAQWTPIEADPDAQLVLFELGELALRDPDLRELAEWEQRAAVDKATEALERLVTDLSWTLARPPRAVAQLTVATVDGVARAWLRHRDDDQARATLSDLASLLATFVAQNGTDL